MTQKPDWRGNRAGGRRMSSVSTHKQKGRRSKGRDSHGVKTGAAPVSGTHVTSAGDDESKIKILMVYGPREISEIII